MTRTLNQNIVAHFDAAAANRPLKAVGHHRADQRRRFGGEVVAYFGAEDIGRQVKIVGKAAEQMRRLVAFGPAAIVGPLPAETLVVAPAIGTAAAAESAFEDNAIAFFDMVNRRGIFAKFLDTAENFMAENNRIVDFELAVKIFDVRAADAAHLDFDQGRRRLEYLASDTRGFPICPVPIMSRRVQLP